MSRSGKVIIVVGASGNGKSTWLKTTTREVDTSRFFCYDVNAEYFDDDDPLPEIDDFLAEMNTKTDCVMVFEEATVFFSNRGSNKTMRQLLVAKRHRRNLIFLVFHSIRSIPYYIYDLVNYVVVFNTNDTEQIVKEKHELLFSAWQKVKDKPFRYEIVKL